MLYRDVHKKLSDREVEVLLKEYLNLPLLSCGRRCSEDIKALSRKWRVSASYIRTLVAKDRNKEK